MPKRLGIDVSVTDTNDNALIEYGLQKDRRFKDRSRVSTFIEAKNGVQFLIRVKVDNPFKFEEAIDPVARLAAVVAKQVQGEHDTRTKRFDNNRPVEEELKTLPGQPPAFTKVPFDLMVSVFIDGREKPECRQMIYLDPKHPRYNSRCVLKGRWVDAGDASSRDGRAGLLQWVFSDRGIDHILELLDVKKVIEGPADADTTEVEALCDVMGEDVFKNSEDRHMKAGQIEIRLRRVISIDSSPVDQTFKAYHYAGSDEKPREIDDDCTHTTSFMPKTTPGNGSKIETFALRHVAWDYYKKHEDFWASFVFNYMARYKLVNLGVCEPDGKRTLMSRTQRPEPDTSSKRGKRRVSSFDATEDEEQAWAERPVAKKASRPSTEGKASGNSHEGEDSDSEEDPDNTAAYYQHQERGRYELRATRVRLDNYEKAKVEDEADQIS
jgi:hypothetical protein